jgi:oxygen-independent coproporphyrinogen-3 oxidase
VDFGVYVHVPFCRRQCPYCTFFTVPRPDADSDLPPRAFGKLLRRMGAALPSGLAGLDEVTVECNPESAHPELLDRLRASGIGRISLGVQSLDADDLQRLGRAATPSQIYAALDAVAERFSTWNADLILGIPGSNAPRLLAALHELGRRQTPHLSLYCLELPPHRARLLGDRQDVDSETVKADLYERASRWIEDNAYEHYEISNAARAGHAAHHNTAYWGGREYVGLGPGAHSLEGEVRRANRADLEAYTAALASGDVPPASCEYLTPEERWRERLLLGLRRRGGVDVAELGLLEQRPWLLELCRRGLAHLRGHRLRLLPRGWLVTDSIVLQLVTAKEESAGRVDNASAPSLHST